VKTCRLIIHRHDGLLGYFESDTPGALEAARDIAARLSASDGYRLELLVADGERRLLESTPQGLRVLSREPSFKPASLDD
jgi:hypothetical protein